MKLWMIWNIVSHAIATLYKPTYARASVYTFHSQALPTLLQYSSACVLIVKEYVKQRSQASWLASAFWVTSHQLRLAVQVVQVAEHSQLSLLQTFIAKQHHLPRSRPYMTKCMMSQLIVTNVHIAWLDPSFKAFDNKNILHCLVENGIQWIMC